MSLHPNADAAIEFLKHFAPDGPWLLVSISPDRAGLSVGEYGPQTEAACRAWIQHQNQRSNVYFHINRAGDGLTKKATKSDIVEVRYLHVDIDARVGQPIDLELERIHRTLTDARPPEVPEPTFIVRSGGGYWGFWRLSPAVEMAAPVQIEAVETRNRRLAELLDGDSTFDVSRIARLPGTVNFPDATKLAKGRTISLAALTSETDNEYSLAAFGPSDASGIGAEIAVHPSAVPTSLSSIHDLDKWSVPDRTKVIVTQGHNEQEGPKEGDDSRSAWLFDGVAGLVRAGVPDGIIMGILLDPTFDISASVLDKGQRARTYAARQIGRAKDAAVDQDLMYMNSRYAVVDVAGKARVAKFVADNKGRERVENLQVLRDFQQLTMNRKKLVGNGEMPIGKWWLNHTLRRQYERIVFEPLGVPSSETLNLWTGFGIEPVPGNWHLMQNHILYVLADGNAQHAEYITKWAAWSVQNPDKMAEVALVLMGKKGTGKSTFGRALAEIFEPHSRQISSSRLLTGNFNAHLRDCCLLFCDEAFWPGDRSAEGPLKSLITEPTLNIEAKNVDVMPMPNRLHIVLATNAEWVVPASVDERRFAIFRLSDQHIQDEAYFAALHREMMSGGLSAMLHQLLAMDLGDWHPRRNIPQTEALRSQQELSLGSVELAVLELLKSGELPDYMTSRPGGGAFIPTSSFFDDVQANDRFATLSAVGNFLGDGLGGKKRHLSLQKVLVGRPRGFLLPGLAEARKLWDQNMFPVEWDEATLWSSASSDDVPF